MINANKDYLNAFYRGDRRYIVPFFQRPYVWDTENWETLWDSLMGVYDDHVNGVSNSEHFIGTLITKQRQALTIDDNSFDLIDGQQRLTSYALLIKALADTCTGELPRIKDKLLELIIFEDAIGKKFLRIVHNRVDRAFFEGIMLCEGELEINEENRILKCYKYFHERVMAFNDQQRDTFLKIIQYKIPVISMLISQDDDEQEIFDTINSLGVRLTTAELLKNYIFKEDELKALYPSHWEAIFETDTEQINFWNKDKTSGRIIRTNIEILLYCFLVIQSEGEVKLEKLYREYKKWLENRTVSEKIEFLNSLKSFSEIYYRLPEGEELNEFAFDEHEKRFFHVIDSLSVTTAYPLILYLYKEASPEDLIMYLRFLESYLIRRNVCKLTTKNYNNLFISILRNLQNIKNANGSFTFEDFRAIFYCFTEETNLFPTDISFAQAFNESALPNQYSKEILFCIALYQRNTQLADVTKLSSSNFSVEHILPKKWISNWSRIALSENGKLIRDKKLLTLGNLTLITKRLNSSLKNDSWERKKATLRKYSSLNITTDYLQLLEWNESTIESRANDLKQLALNIWPR